jgi:hypothetical protein
MGFVIVGGNIPAKSRLRTRNAIEPTGYYFPPTRSLI